MFVHYLTFGRVTLIITYLLPFDMWFIIYIYVKLSVNALAKVNKISNFTRLAGNSRIMPVQRLGVNFGISKTLSKWSATLQLNLLNNSSCELVSHTPRKH